MTPSMCKHCQLPLEEAHIIGEGFCCHGCETVYHLLHQEGLDRYYSLADGQTPPVHVSSDSDYAWLERELQRNQDSGQLDVSVQGIHCAACVWLLEEVFERQAGGQEILINPTLGTLTLRFDPKKFDPVDYFTQMERMGYKATQRRAELQRTSETLLWRMGISVALSMNVMLIYISFYMGLTPEDELFTLFWWVSIVLTILNVGIGGWPFMKTSFLVLQKGMLHLDLPIAVGIVSTFVANLLLIQTTGADQLYLDSLNSFITLMLVGRFLQTRSIEKNRQHLQQQEEGSDWRITRVVEREGVSQQETISVQEIGMGERLLVPVGTVLPVDSELLFPNAAQLNLAWINGESQPVQVAVGEILPSGSINQGMHALEVRTTGLWSTSTLNELLTIPPSSEQEDVPQWFQPILRWYVPIVLMISIGGLLFWWSSGLQQAISVMTALLIVTCPCAFGIALPLAKELAVLQLRTRGVFVRTGRFFAYADQIKQVVFDKTGTLTLGTLRAKMSNELEAEYIDVLYNMVSRSSHPKSVAIHQLLTSKFSQCIQHREVEVQEKTGVGLRWQSYRLEQDSEQDTRFTKGEQVLATFQFTEELRGPIAEIVSQLQQHVDVSILSGDQPRKVQELIQRLGLSEVQGVGGMTPQDKANWILEQDAEHTLMVGDGLNDAKAFDVARLSVTPANHLGGLLARSDVYITGDNLRSIWTMLRMATFTIQTQQQVFAFALVYNIVVIVISFTGRMSPLLAAILMPLSSIALVSYTLWRQQRKLRML